MAGRSCRILKLCSDFRSTEYEIHEAEPRISQLAWSSLINYQDKEIFVLGGRSGGRYAAPKSLVENYNVATNRWSTETPSLQEARAGASGCSLPDYIYIFCGMKEQRIRLNSIERLRILTLEKPRMFVDPEWQLI